MLLGNFQNSNFVWHKWTVGLVCVARLHQAVIPERHSHLSRCHQMKIFFFPWWLFLLYYFLAIDNSIAATLHQEVNIIQLFSLRPSLSLPWAIWGVPVALRCNWDAPTAPRTIYIIKYCTMLKVLFYKYHEQHY